MPTIEKMEIYTNSAGLTWNFNWNQLTTSKSFQLFVSFAKQWIDELGSREWLRESRVSVAYLSLRQTRRSRNGILSMAMTIFFIPSSSFDQIFILNTSLELHYDNPSDITNRYMLKSPKSKSPTSKSPLPKFLRSKSPRSKSHKLFLCQDARA